MKKIRKGAITLEFVLNILIYIPFFILLFSMSLIPLRQFYLTQAARDAGLVYIQIKYYEGDIVDLKNIFKTMLPDIQEPNWDTITENKSEVAKKLVEYYIQKQLEKSTALPGKLFDLSKIKVDVSDTGTAQGNNAIKLATSKIWKFLTHFFVTEGVTIKVSYEYTLLKIFNFSFSPFTITGEYYVEYNP